MISATRRKYDAYSANARAIFEPANDTTTAQISRGASLPCAPWRNSLSASPFLWEDRQSERDDPNRNLDVRRD